MLQPKGTDWLNRHKNKTHIYAVYKKPLPTSRHILIKLIKTKHKERILNAAREKQ